MTTRTTQTILLLASLTLAGGLGCASPSTTSQASAKRQTNDDTPPPLYLKNGQRNPDGPTPL